jgi:prepilin-type N-terminal cleavage/methylation domain-containing protein
MNTRRRQFGLRNSGGFTLVEVLVALVITGLIMGGITTAIIQMLMVNNQNTNSITAQRQVQQVGSAVSTDVLQARDIPPPSGTGFPLVLTWTDMEGNIYLVTYRLSDGIVYRDVKINNGATNTRAIAESISNAVFSQVSTGYYNLSITATIPGKINVTESRTYEIKTRVSS